MVALLILGLAALPCARGQSTLYTASFDLNTVGNYTSTGGTNNANFITSNVDGPVGLAYSSFNNRLYVANENGGYIGEFRTNGTVVNSTLINVGAPQSGVGALFYFAVDASTGNLFVPNHLTGNIAEYTASGTLVNSRFITGVTAVIGIAISPTNGNIYVTTTGGKVGEYTTAGVTVNASLITGLTDPANLAIQTSTGNLFITENSNGASGAGFVGEYSSTGSVVNANLITSLDEPYDIAFDPNNGYLDIAEYSGGRISQYTPAGVLVNGSLLSIGGVDGLAFAPVPEPADFALLVGAGLLGVVGFRRRRAGPVAPTIDLHT